MFTYASPTLSVNSESGGIPSRPVSCGIYCIQQLAPNSYTLWSVIRRLPSGVHDYDPLTPSQLLSLGVDCEIPFSAAYTSYQDDTLTISAIDTLRSLAEIGENLPHVIVGYPGDNGNHYVVAFKMTGYNSLEIWDPASVNNVSMPIHVIQAIVF